MLRRAFRLCLNIFAFQFASEEISSFNADSQQVRDPSDRLCLLQQGQRNHETFLEVWQTWFRSWEIIAKTHNWLWLCDGIFCDVSHTEATVVIQMIRSDSRFTNKHFSALLFCTTEECDPLTFENAKATVAVFWNSLEINITFVLIGWFCWSFLSPDILSCWTTYVRSLT